MLKLIHTFFVMALASPLYAAPLATWSGAGPNACYGRCSLEWAATVLTPSEHEQLIAAMVDQPEPTLLHVQDGAVFSLSTYFKDGAPYAYRTTTVAVLDRPEPAMGWELDGWTFAKLQACDNWTIITNETIPTAGFPSSTLPPVGVALVVPASYAPLPKPFIVPSLPFNGDLVQFPETIISSGSSGGDTLPLFSEENVPSFFLGSNNLGSDITPVLDIDETHGSLSVVPLPSSIWFLLASVFGLAAVRLGLASRRKMLLAATGPVQN